MSQWIHSPILLHHIPLRINEERIARDTDVLLAEHRLLFEHSVGFAYFSRRICEKGKVELISVCKLRMTRHGIATHT